MPPKKKKGKKKKNPVEKAKRVLTIKSDMEEYGKILKTLGDRRLRVVLPDNSEILAIIPGRFKKRCWMKIDDIILVSNRGYQDDRYDVIHKYNDDELRTLLKQQEIPPFFLDAGAKGSSEWTGDGTGIMIGEVEQTEEEFFDSI